jgi:hypothetical protein
LHRGATGVSHVEQVARWLTASERTIDMTDLRKCVGSVRFEIEAHDAPEADFPAQPSQKDGLGRMCKVHWNQYTTALRKAALARQAADGGMATEVAPTKSDRAAAKGARTDTGDSAKLARKPEPIRTKPARGPEAEGDVIVKAGEAGTARGTADVEEASIA